MHKYTFTLSIFFLSLLITINTRAMERECDLLVKETKEKVEPFPFLQLPLDLQNHVIAVDYIHDVNIKIDDKKFAELKGVVRTFFTLNCVCKYLHQHIVDKKIKLPWSDLSNAYKNEMVKKTISCMTNKGAKEKGISVPLAFVYAGADPHVMVCGGYMPLVSYVLTYVKDKSIIKMLLKHGADPCAVSSNLDSVPCCFNALTPEIGKLLVKKIVDKDEFLKKFSSMTGCLLGKQRPVEMMQFWIDYGLNPRHLNNSLDSLFHVLVLTSKYGGNDGNKLENILAKTELLLTCMPDMMNHKNNKNQTPLDTAIAWIERYNGHDWLEILKELLIKHGAKITQQLEADKQTNS